LVKRQFLAVYFCTQDDAEGQIFFDFVYASQYGQYNFIPYGQDGHDPLYKLQYFINLLKDKYRNCINPEQHISLDEGTCPFKGRVKFRVYNKDKPNKWGIKM
jgi:hypothetical protein